MACKYCHMEFGHDPSCPNYEPKKSKHRCCVCGEVILIGENVIENVDGVFAHDECCWDSDVLIKFLEGEIKVMGEEM